MYQVAETRAAPCPEDEAAAVVGDVLEPGVRKNLTGMAAAAVAAAAAASDVDGEHDPRRLRKSSMPRWLTTSTLAETLLPLRPKMPGPIVVRR